MRLSIAFEYPSFTYLPTIDRLENEHLGNMDQYRITREVPLPYHFEEEARDDDDDDVDEENTPTRSKWLRRRPKKSSAETILVGES